MKQSIKDYIHLYMGRPCIEAIKVPGQESVWDIGRVNTRVIWNANYELSDLKLILRPMSDLTEKITYDGETFIPLVKLKQHGVNGYTSINKYDGEICRVYDAEGHSLNYSRWDGFFTEYRGHTSARNNQDMFRKLLIWGFDIFDLLRTDFAITEQQVKNYIKDEQD